MTVLLILATFAIFLGIEYYLSQRRVAQPAVVAAAPAPRLRPEIVAGFRLPENLRYHPGHTWALGESPQMVRIGLDDFAARLLGTAERIELPRRGQWVRQGQKVVTVQRDGAKAELVAPVEGMITEVNDALAANPALALADPYGDGWLVKLQSPDARLNFRNLLGGALARRWMEEAAQRLFGRMPQLAGAVAQDGGVAVSDLTVHLPEARWEELTREFFLS